ncbi:MAG TPA: hypothetical protein QGF58_11785 [Myxococcota bacterium]|nr:hypothetical protein [Myxococcota bacterium]
MPIADFEAGAPWRAGNGAALQRVEVDGGHALKVTAPAGGAVRSPRLEANNWEHGRALVFRVQKLPDSDPVTVRMLSPSASAMSAADHAETPSASPESPPCMDQLTDTTSSRETPSSVTAALSVARS